jgi:hypothetical protein
VREDEEGSLEDEDTHNGDGAISITASL